MKNVYINGRFLTQKITGVQRYAIELVKALDALMVNRDLAISIILLVPAKPIYKLDLKNISLQTVGRLTGHAWEQVELPFYTKDGLLVNLCNTGPMFKQNQVVTIHDVSVYGFPVAYSLLFRCWRDLRVAVITAFSLSKDSRAVVKVALNVPFAIALTMFCIFFSMSFCCL